MELSDHFFHYLLAIFPLILGVLLFKPWLTPAFQISLKKGLMTVGVILILIHFGVSEPLMSLHHQSSQSSDHFCCIIQPSLSSVETPILPTPPPQNKLTALSQIADPESPIFLPHSSRAPPLS